MGLKNFIEKIKDSLKPIPFDASVFNDPLADKTAWHPQARGGANFKTRTLKEISSSELHYKGSTGGLLFALVFTIMPLIVILIFIFSGFFSSDQEFSFAFLFVFIFPIVGFYLLYMHFRPIVLDKRLGYFYKSFKKPVNSLQRTSTKNHIKLTSIAALQIIPEHIRSKNSSYTSYELNFVFENGERYNIIDHAKYEAIEKEAITISEFLGVPLWDASTMKTYLPMNNKNSMDTDAPYDSAGYDSTRRYRDM
ncbi:hypothetical protein GCM10011344_09500 [Dokdonia pacifica]|uniref:Uncharacterized protein n=1 Tax=Dokdonia pacifica TaxID=1627892 RepID=A0A238YR96_9FLAO|nr:hypothetical protein [Dokdonia pacifica]GGG10912.1 hypothetical protein GCM10011344_09500 [Dokdonia pacifica]SNR72959.1 hypothetical protein SAMN06265376_102247 [Dokdonia pacifica]